MREFLTFSDEAEWLSLREKDLTSTEVAALFDCSPYLTEYELYHRKTGQLAIELEVNDRMRWGNRLEAAIAYGVAEDLGLRVEPFKVYGRLPGQRIGSSFDFKVVGLDDSYTGTDDTYRDLFREHGPGVLECKNVDGLAFLRGWTDDADGIEAPVHIELQVQHQLAVSGLKWSIVAPLIGGNMPRPFYRLADERVIGAIYERAAAFWLRVDERRCPDPNFSKDGATIAQLLLEDDGQVVDLSDNPRFTDLLAEYDQARADEKVASGRKDAAKAELLTIMGHAAKGLGDGFNVSATTVNSSEGTLITPSMVGMRVGGRKSYRGFRVNAKK